MDWKRLWRHLHSDHRAVRRAFPPRVLREIERAISAQEQRHAGELRFAVEGSLPLAALLRGVDARARAIEWFSRLRVWDTEHNCGVLVYLLLADRRVEIVADRGIHARVSEEEWRSVCRRMQEEFARGEFARGALQGIEAIGDLLAAHFPRRGGKPNELPDAPVVI